MFGKNAVLRREPYAGTYAVQEIFPTLQGEGPLAGTPAVFVRLGGCNLRCYFCDTDFESHNVRKTPEEILRAVRELAGSAIKLVVITGGEPMRQSLAPLLQALGEAGCCSQIETAGTLWEDAVGETMSLQYEITIVCSPKTGTVHPQLRAHCRDYKYIVNATYGNESAQDGLPLFSTQDRGKIRPVWRPIGTPDMWRDQIWIQPEAAYTPTGERDPVMTERNTQHAVRLCMRWGYRLSLQQHTLLGLP